MRTHAVSLIPGDGSGPELVAAARSVLDAVARAAGFRLSWDVQAAGQHALSTTGTLLPAGTLASIRQCGVALKGPTTTPVGAGHRSVNIAIRRELDLYACLRPVRAWPGSGAVHPDIDLVVVRENTEDVYAGFEYPYDSDVAGRVADRLGLADRGGVGISLKPITEAGSRRVIRFAFEYARRHGRRLVQIGTDTFHHPLTEGLFARTGREVAAAYPDVAGDLVSVTTLCASLVRTPTSHDVLVLPNLYGDVVSDVTAALVGGLGMAPGANIGDRIAVFEATHGSAPQFAGTNRLNPTGLILSGCMLLDHLGEHDAATRVRTAVHDVLHEGTRVTFDLRTAASAGDAASTTEYTSAVIDRLDKT